MQEPTPLDVPEQLLEAQILRLRPTRITVRADELWYRAGYAAGRRRARFWQAAAAGLTLFLAAAVLWRPRAMPTAVDQQVAQSPAPRPMLPDEPMPLPAASTPYFKLRDSMARDAGRAAPGTLAGEFDDRDVVRAWPVRAAPEGPHRFTVEAGERGGA